MLSGFDNPIHLAFVFLIVLMLFGAKRLPEIGNGLGTGIRGFRDGLTMPHDPARPEPDPGIAALQTEVGSPNPSPATLPQKNTGNPLTSEDG
jgi:sec-independent protein translocase protein TatA